MLTSTYHIALSVTTAESVNHSFPQSYTSHTGAYTAILQEVRALVPQHLTLTTSTDNQDGSYEFRYENADATEIMEVVANIVQTS